MAKTEADKPLGAEALAHAQEVDSAWSPTRLTRLGLITLAIAISVIIFIATRLTTCMYLDGSR